jgi:hypothetical protein
MAPGPDVAMADTSCPDLGLLIAKLLAKSPKQARGDAWGLVSAAAEVANPKLAMANTAGTKSFRMLPSLCVARSRAAVTCTQAALARQCASGLSQAAPRLFGPLVFANRRATVCMLERVGSLLSPGLSLSVPVATPSRVSGPI